MGLSNSKYVRITKGSTLASTCLPSPALYRREHVLVFFHNKRGYCASVLPPLRSDLKKELQVGAEQCRSQYLTAWRDVCVWA